ncbi:hypothetical protein ABBQ32_001928 [Trebouxia sp. C0010 RCD-2024]
MNLTQLELAGTSIHVMLKTLASRATLNEMKCCHSTASSRLLKYNLQQQSEAAALFELYHTASRGIKACACDKCRCGCNVMPLNTRTLTPNEANCAKAHVLHFQHTQYVCNLA